MLQLAAAALMLVLTSGAASLILLLPIVVAAESLPLLCERTVRRFWITANILPLAAGCLLTGAAFLFLLGDFTATPHQERARPHFCLQQFTTAPDAPFRFKLAAVMALGLVAYALVRFVLSLRASHQAEAVAWRLVTVAGPSAQEEPSVGRPSPPTEGPSFSRPRPDAPLLVLDHDDPDCFSLGLLHPVVLATSALPDVLTDAEIAAVVAHEQCHVRHRDNLTELVVRLVTDPLVWVPSTHYLLHSLRAVQEQSCDAAAAGGHSAETMVSALQKMEEAKKAQQVKLQGDLAPFRRLFPAYASPGARVAALLGQKFTSVALPLPVIVALEATVFVVAAVWCHRPLHDTLYCAAASLLRVLGG